MDKLKTKLHLGGKMKSKVGGRNEENEISEIKKFYMHLQKAMGSVLQPGHRFKPTISSKKGKAPTAVYEERGLVTFINKYNKSIAGNFHQALQDMANAYEQIMDFKSSRDSRLQAELFGPINNSVLKDLERISLIKKEANDAEAEVCSARKATEKNPQDQSAQDRLNRANGNFAQAKEKLHGAISSFKREEANRIAMFIQSAQIQQEFFKKAADTFSQLTANLQTIKERSANTSIDESGTYNGKPNQYDLPDDNFGYTTKLKGFNSPAPNVSQPKERRQPPPPTPL